ncbi:hypothetical protein [Pseudobdellovibrio sp. HCB154]|uniref:hypothetical protein n=1 Tax=Pseudobdellovibrio sp. HCB154 TaxID=3386277 RepID=UPI003916E803
MKKDLYCNGRFLCEVYATVSVESYQEYTVSGPGISRSGAQAERIPGKIIPGVMAFDCPKEHLGVIEANGCRLELRNENTITVIGLLSVSSQTVVVSYS